MPSEPHPSNPIGERKLIAVTSPNPQTPHSLQPIANRWALLVGINRYIDPAFSPLNFCVNDVITLEQLLTQLNYTVVCLHDELDRGHPRFPTRDNIEAELKRLCDAVGEPDLLLVHFACHGTLVNHQPVLIAQDTRYTTLDTKALPLMAIETQMRQSQASRLVLVLDACHTGVEIGRDILSDPEFIRNAHDLAEGFALIAASTAQQVAQEWQAMSHGVFTYYLLEGLGGKADQTNKGFVTINDLQTYVLNSLRRWNVQNGGLAQEPTARTEGLGDMILADYREHPLTFPLSIPVIASLQSASQRVSQKLLQTYDQALILLETTPTPSPEQVLTVLRIRDRVQADLANTDAADLIQLEECDRRLKSQKVTVAKAIALTHSRQTLNPPETSWWWFLEPDAPYPWLNQPNWVWNAMTVLPLAISGGLVINMWSYFLAGGLNAVGVGGIAFNSLVTLITGGSAIAQVKQEARDDLLTRLKLPKWSWKPISGSAAIVIMLVLSGVRISLPSLSIHYQKSGEQKFRTDKPDLEGALTDYQQAIALQPGNTEARYDLGLVYEAIPNYDQAIAEYLLAIQTISKATNPLTEIRVNNNLGRLYLLKGDATKAFPSLERVLSLVTEDELKNNPEIQKNYYSVLKNMGWQRLLKKRYPEADALLQDAIALNPERAAAHCLQAQVLEDQEQNKSALAAWQICSQYANRRIPEEDLWIGRANNAAQRLGQKGGKP
jgi:tetratricopeptide (TPR) repeat protein